MYTIFYDFFKEIIKDKMNEFHFKTVLCVLVFHTDFFALSKTHFS